MIRSELLNSLAQDNPDLRAEEVEQVVDIFFEEIAQRLSEGGRVELRGFGAFSTREREARKGRNPRTGETVDVLEEREGLTETRYDRGLVSSLEMYQVRLDLRTVQASLPQIETQLADAEGRMVAVGVALQDRFALLGRDTREQLTLALCRRMGCSDKRGDHRRGQGGLTVVNVADGADVDVRFCSLEGAFGHFELPLAGLV